MENSVKLVIGFLATAFLAGAQVDGNGGKRLDTTTSLEELMDVQIQTATLRKQSLQDAPASVTVVTAEDIRRYGYRTLSEALSNVRSFYTTSDGPSAYVGARGFSLLGDYNTRFLVLINGHHLTDNVYGAMYYFGQDFPLDMSLVEQIEIVRGPSSALYGSNGLFATVNIITKTPGNAAQRSVTGEIGQFGRQKLTASSTFPLGKEAKVLVSASVLHTGGRTVAFPELANAGASPSRTDHVGDEAGYHLFADLTWRNWTVTALFGQHKYLVPSGWFGTDFGDTGTTDLESRNFVEAAWSRPVGKNGEIRWRTYYDQYRYDGVYAYDGYRNFDGASGDWVGSQFVYQHQTSRFGTITVGGEVNVDLRNLQYNFGVTTSDAGSVRQDNFRISHPRKAYGVFVQEEFQLSPAWTAYLGGRVDHSTQDAPTFSPRLALVYKRSGTTYKLMYGRAFRNPSTFERYWEPNVELHAEQINTFEIAREQKVHRRVNLITSAFHYRLGGLIEGVPISDDKLQYRNSSRADATGLEMEVNGQPTDWLETVGSFSVQRTRGTYSGGRLQNSPVRLGQFRASVPLADQRLILGGAVRYVGSRLGADGSGVPAVTLADLTVTAPRLHPHMELQFGIRNLMNAAYADPLSPEHLTHLMPGAGRSVYVRLSWHRD
jgi:outer membrane receptor protein involved in Fe transport